MPPWRAACWHQGQLSNAQWTPFFVCKAVGDAIERVMRARPDQHLTVLCGHTHGAGEARPLPNVHVITGAAEYYRPAITGVFEVASQDEREIEGADPLRKVNAGRSVFAEDD